MKVYQVLLLYGFLMLTLVFCRRVSALLRAPGDPAVRGHARLRAPEGALPRPVPEEGLRLRRGAVRLGSTRCAAPATSRAAIWRVVRK